MASQCFRCGPGRRYRACTANVTVAAPGSARTATAGGNSKPPPIPPRSAAGGPISSTDLQRRYRLSPLGVVCDRPRPDDRPGPTNGRSGKAYATATRSSLAWPPTPDSPSPTTPTRSPPRPLASTTTTATTTHLPTTRCATRPAGSARVSTPAAPVASSPPPDPAAPTAPMWWHTRHPSSGCPSGWNPCSAARRGPNYRRGRRPRPPAVEFPPPPLPGRRWPPSPRRVPDLAIVPLPGRVPGCGPSRSGSR